MKVWQPTRMAPGETRTLDPRNLFAAAYPLSLFPDARVDEIDRRRANPTAAAIRWEDVRKEKNYSSKAEWEAAGAFAGEIFQTHKVYKACLGGPWACAKGLWKGIQKAGPAYEPHIPDH